MKRFHILIILMMLNSIGSYARDFDSDNDALTIFIHRDVPAGLETFISFRTFDLPIPSQPLFWDMDGFHRRYLVYYQGNGRGTDLMTSDFIRDGKGNPSCIAREYKKNLKNY